MSIILYETAGADPALRFSPYCWRIRFALAHKGLPTETIPWRLTEKDVIAFSGQDRVPVIQDAGMVVSDSWAIAVYLEKHYPAPVIFGSAAAEAHALFVNAWADSVLMPAISRLIVRDMADVIDLKDVAYFRASREARFGISLEAVQAGREDRIGAFRELLAPVRVVLQRQDWLGGAGPSYADHILAGTLMWPWCISAFPMLDPADKVAGWFGRVLDLYNGPGRAAVRAH